MVLWRSCCGLEGLKRTTWTPCWLRVGINKASWSFRSAKHVSESLHAESNLRSDVLENRKLAKTIVKTIVFSRPQVLQDGPRKAPGIILRDLPVARRTFLGPSWAYLGLSWALLGPSPGVLGGTLRQILGLEGLILGCKVAKS